MRLVHSRLMDPGPRICLLAVFLAASGLALPLPAQPLDVVSLIDVVPDAGDPTLAAAAMLRPSRPADDPVVNFERLWKTFDENYAFFDLRKVDWKAAHATYRPRVGPATTPVELYDIMRDMTDSLDDDHVSLTVPSEISSKGRPRPGEGLAEPDFPSLQLAIARRYVPSPRSFANGKILSGPIRDQVGYIQINTMEDLGGKESDDEGPVTREIDAVVRGFQSMTAVILDIRFNGGGYEDITRMILNRFADRKMRLFSKRERKGSGFGPREWFEVEPARIRFVKPVFVLTSRQTGSAAESLALASMALPRFTRIGSTTNGILSDQYEGVLPNRWKFTLSNQVVEALDGQVYEVRGIPPDHPLDYPKDPAAFHKLLQDGLVAGDPAIEKALELGRSGPGGR